MKRSNSHLGLPILIVLSLCFFGRSGFAIEELPKHYRGTRSAGMGGNLYTTGNYAEALFGNPARHSEVDTWKISLIDLSAETNTNTLTAYQKLSKVTSESGSGVISSASSFMGKNQHARVQDLLAFYHPHLIGDLGFAFGAFFSTQTNILVRYTTDVDAQLYADVGPTLGLSYPFLNKRLSLGVNLRALYRVAIDQNMNALDFLVGGKKLTLSSIGNQGIGGDGDVGAYYHVPWDISFMRIGLAAAITNVAQSQYNLTTQPVIKKLGLNPPRNDRLYHAGVRLDFPDMWFLSAPLLAIEYQDYYATTKSYSWGKSIHMGGEVKFLRRILSARLGFNQGYYTAGLGIDLPLLKIDAATYGEELTGNAGVMEDRRYIVRLAIEI